MSQQSLKFRFSGKLAQLLGRESVSSDTAALFELVKNGYDADASKVTVAFENFASNRGKDATITIEDSGDGMTYDDIVNKCSRGCRCLAVPLSRTFCWRGCRRY